MVIREMDKETGEDDWNNGQSLNKKVSGKNNNNNNNEINNDNNRDGTRRRVKMIGIIVRARTRRFLKTTSITMMITIREAILYQIGGFFTHCVNGP